MLKRTHQAVSPRRTYHPDSFSTTSLAFPPSSSFPLIGLRLLSLQSRTLHGTRTFVLRLLGSTKAVVQGQAPEPARMGVVEVEPRPSGLRMPSLVG